MRVKATCLPGSTPEIPVKASVEELVSSSTTHEQKLPRHIHSSGGPLLTPRVQTHPSVPTLSLVLTGEREYNRNAKQPRKKKRSPCTHAEKGEKRGTFTRRSSCKIQISNAGGGIRNSSSCRCRCIPSPMPTETIHTSRILLAFLIISLLLFVILAFLFLYLCRAMLIRRRNTTSPAAAATPPPQALDEDTRAVGLDPSLVASFPIFTYSWVKNLHAGECGLECSVCLSEFQDDDALRLLPACSHVFHTHCIDVWLMSHTTCPYCRHQLNPAEKKPPSPPEVRIAVAEAAVEREAFDETRGEGEEEERREEEGSPKRMVRSNSTGHSSLGREDRFTLRLPEDVKERIARERNWTGSCIDFRHLFGDHDDGDRQIGRSGLSEGGSHS